MEYTSIMTNEVWKDIPQYDGVYQVSNKGRIRSFAQSKSGEPKLMYSASNGSGYRYVTLCKGGKRRNWYIHRLVATAFIGDITNGLVINHLDHDRSNNSVENLEITTQRNNVHYSSSLMRKPKSRKGNYYITDRGNRFEVYVKLKYLGSYKTIEEARRARDEYINKIHYD